MTSKEIIARFQSAPLTLSSGKRKRTLWEISFLIFLILTSADETCLRNKPMPLSRKPLSFLWPFLAFFSLSALLFSVSSSAHPTLESKATSANKVRVGWYPSAGLQDGQSDDALDGYNYEYLCKIAQYTGWNYEFVYDNWSNLEAKLIAGDIDLIGDVAQTEARLQNYSFCTYPNGSSRMLMITRGNDKRFFYDDYAAFNGMIVGTIHSSFRKSLLDREASQHNFTITYKEYDTDGEMFAGLDRGETDTAILSNVTRYQNYRVISEWEPNPFYFVVNKNKTDLLSELNNAMTQIQSSDIFMQERLFEKYFEGNDEGSMIALTKEEDAYIQSQPNFEVLICDKDRPLSYQANGEIRGIIPDYLNLLKEKIGLSYHYQVFDNHATMLNAFRNGEGSLCGQFPDDFQYSQENSAMLSQPYISLTYGFVSTPQKIDQLKKVAYEEGDSFFGRTNHGLRL